MNIGGFLRRNGVAIVLVGGVAGLIVLILYPAFTSARENARRSKCWSQLHSITLACSQYQEDYGGKLPPLSGGNSRGWAQILQDRDASLKFSCPSGYESSFSPTSDYFFNARLAARKQASVRDPMMTISFGEGPDNGPTNSHYWELPNDGENRESPLGRHLGGANYAFADGHIRWLRLQGLKSWMAENSEGRITFSPN